MTKKLKIPKIALYLFYGLALFMYTNCSVEEDLIELNKSIIHRKINFEEIKKDDIIMDNLTNYSKFMKQASLKQKSTDSLVVDISFANYIETDDFISYTFNMPTSSVPLRNFLLKKQKNSTGGFHGYILNYNLTQEELILFNNLQLSNLNEKVTSIKIGSNFSPAMFGKNNKSAGNCDAWVGMCHNAWGGGVDFAGHPATSNECVVTSFQYQTIDCPEGGSVGGGGGTPPPSDGSGGGNNPVVIIPTKKDNGITINISLDNEPCVNLNKISIDFKLTNVLNQLKNQTNLPVEKGFAIEKDPFNNSFKDPTPASADPIRPEAIAMNNYLGGDFIGLFHTHPPFVYPMFTHGDIDALFWLARRHNSNGSPKNYGEYIITMTAPQGTYALKIKDWAKFQSLRNNRWEGKDGLKDVLKDNFLKREIDGDINLLIKDILDIFKSLDAGIGLYKSDDSFGNWSEIVHELNPMSPNFGQPKLIPCN